MRPELGHREVVRVMEAITASTVRPQPHDQCPMAVALRTGEPVRGVRGDRRAARRHACSLFSPYPTPFKDANGKVTGAVNLLVDVTDLPRGRDEFRSF